MTLGNEGSILRSLTDNEVNSIDRIDGGAQHGSNLFHSFSDFNINSGQQIYFANPTGVSNIFSRVTGVNLSNIDGTLGVLGEANLFLINPNGIVFGPNAQLDIRGSFVASTTNQIHFPNGDIFDATHPDSSHLLTVDAPLGLAAWLPAASPITSAGHLVAGQSLTLLGSEVTVTGTLVAPGGTVQVLGNQVALLDGARIDVSSASGGGSVFLGGSYQGQGPLPNARQTYVAPTATIQADAISTGSGGQVTVWADDTAHFYGNISALGGAIAGNGGVVEVSSAGRLTFNGVVNTSAFAGIAGTLLLDPTTITVVPGNIPDPPSLGDGLWATLEDLGNQTIGAGTIAALLTTNAVTLEATDTISFMPNADVIVSSGNPLTLHARTINFTNVTLAQLGAGNIILNTTQNRGTSASTTEGTAVFADGSYIGTAVVGTVPQAGDVRVITGSLTAINGAEFGANTFGDGSAGNVQLTVSGAVNFDGAGPIPKGLATVLGISDPTAFGVNQLPSGVSSIVAPGATGNGGNLDITAGSLTLTQGGTLTAGTFGAGNAGNVVLTVEDAASFDGTFPDGQGSSGVFSVVYPGATGNGGSIDLVAGSLTVTNGAEISAASNGSLTLTNGGISSSAGAGVGDAGRVTVSVSGAARFDGVSTDGQFPSGVFSTVQTGAEGNGGNLDIITDSLFVTNGAQLSASTLGFGDAGSITIKANAFDASAGGQVLTQTFSSGRAGNIAIQALDRMLLSDHDTGIFANTASGSTGNGGNIQLDSRRALIQDGASISVNSQGSGTGGSIFLQARSLTLRDRGSITAETFDTQGGNIALNLQDGLFLQNSSRISTNAGSSGAGGNGGNITINTPYLVAEFNDNSDITANAFAGQGGNVDITAEGIFGFHVLSRADLEAALGTSDPNQLNPALLPTSDITAISQVSPSLSGVVTIQSPDVDPSQGVLILSDSVIDTSRLIAVQGCTAGSAEAVRFGRLVFTGRGGLPSSPFGLLQSNMVLTDWVSLPEAASDTAQLRATHFVWLSSPVQLIEVQTLERHVDGQIVLAGKAPVRENQEFWHPSVPCST